MGQYPDSLIQGKGGDRLPSVCGVSAGPPGATLVSEPALRGVTTEHQHPGTIPSFLSSPGPRGLRYVPLTLPPPPLLDHAPLLPGWLGPWLGTFQASVQGPCHSAAPSGPASVTASTSLMSLCRCLSEGFLCSYVGGMAPALDDSLSCACCNGRSLSFLSISKTPPPSCPEDFPPSGSENSIICHVCPSG